MTTKDFAVGAGVGVIATILVAIAAGLTVVYTGAYDVAATDRHFDPVRWAFDTTMHRSVAGRAEGIEEPEEIGSDLVMSGAETYGSTCVHCHGGPGVERAEWAASMRPMPPELTEAAAEWEPREVFWIVENGIKMTGMPAFGPEHDEAELWGIVAFAKQLPGMTPEEFQSLTGGSNEHGGRDSSGQTESTAE